MKNLLPGLALVGATFAFLGSAQGALVDNGGPGGALFTNLSATGDLNLTPFPDWTTRVSFNAVNTKNVATHFLTTAGGGIDGGSTTGGPSFSYTDGVNPTIASGVTAFEYFLSATPNTIVYTITDSRTGVPGAGLILQADSFNGGMTISVIDGNNSVRDTATLNSSGNYRTSIDLSGVVGPTATITFTTSGGGQNIGVNAVAVTPEPASLGLLGVAGLGLLVRRRRNI